MSSDIVTYGAITHAVANALKVTNGVKKIEAYDELSEDIPVTPMLHVYPESGEVSADSDTDRASFDASVRLTRLVINIDGYARLRSHRQHDIKAQVDLIDAIDAVLVQQNVKPFFGMNDIRAFSWKWERGNLEAEKYAGCKFTLTLWIY